MTASALVSELRALTIASTKARFDMHETTVDDRFQSRRGDWNGRPLTLVTDVLVGRGLLSRLHVASIESGDGSVASLTVLALPRAAAQAPLLGADIVAFAETFATVIFDLFPVRSVLANAASDRVREARALLESAGQRRPLDVEVFSPWATAVTSGPEGEPLIRRAYANYLSAFVESLGTAPICADAAPEAHAIQCEFLARLSGVKKQMKALSRLFGSEWTSAYFDEVFLSRSAVS